MDADALLLATLNRIETKLDAWRLEAKGDLAIHAAENDKKFEAVDLALDDLRGFKRVQLSFIALAIVIIPAVISVLALVWGS